MSILFDDARISTRPHRRSTTGLWVSVAAHAIVVAVLIVDPIRASETPAKPRMRSRLVFTLPATAFVKVPSVPVVIARPPAPPPPRPVPELAPEPLPVAPLVAKRIEPPPTPIAPERPIEKPEIKPETGLFERTNAARTSQAATAVTTGGFGNAAASPRDTAVGTVTTGGFGRTAAVREASNGPANVKMGGFGNEAAAPRRVATGEVQTSGFDQRASAPVRPAVAATAPIDRPVEIVSKPTPEYTDEARTARIEGTVSLELEFTAGGDIRVLRVVRGLGHGLDEAAQRAALRIRFKPAQSAGQPVDSRATVHITFRLS